MHLIGIGEARQDEHLRSGRMPIGKIGRARFRVTAHLIGEFSGNGWDALNDQVFRRSDCFGRGFICREGIVGDEEKEERKEQAERLHRKETVAALAGGAQSAGAKQKPALPSRAAAKLKARGGAPAFFRAAPCARLI